MEEAARPELLSGSHWGRACQTGSSCRLRGHCGAVVQPFCSPDHLPRRGLTGQLLLLSQVSFLEAVVLSVLGRQEKGDSMRRPLHVKA